MSEVVKLTEVKATDKDLETWLAMSPEQKRESLDRAIKQEERKEQMLQLMQDHCMTKTYPIKKILAEPRLLGDWLCEQWMNLSEVRSERPIFKHMEKEFRKMWFSLSEANTEVNRLLEGKARRIARRNGYSINKGKAPYSDTNQGLFRVLDEEGKICAGWNFDLSAQEVISLFRGLDYNGGKAKFDEYKERHLANTAAKKAA